MDAKQINEIVDCGKDPKYFINRYCKIADPTKGLLPFKLFPFQQDCIDAFQKHKYNIVNKSRQLGLSTTTAAYCLWMVLFQRDKNILILATKKTTAMNIIKKIKVMLASLPAWLILPQINSETKQSIEFSNRSQVVAIPTSEDAGRSEALSLLVVDETAHIPKFSEIWTGLSPTLSTGGSVILISTPLGVGNMFHSIWIKAQNGENGFNPIELPWTVHPQRGEKWYKEQCGLLLNSPRKIGQELHCEFSTSGDTFLSVEDIAWIGQNIQKPIDRWGEDKHVWIWKYPLTEKKYIISADVSRGDSDDYSACHIIDIGTGEVVGEYKGKIPPDRFGELLVFLGKKYNTALLCPENNSYGYSTLITLKNLNYPKIYRNDNEKSFYIGGYSPVSIDTDLSKYGFHTSGKTRLQILTKLEEVIRNRYIKIYSSRFYDELKSFIWDSKSGKAKAGKRANDDLIISMAIGSWLYDVAGGYSKHDTNTNQAIIQGMGVSSMKFTDIPNNGSEVVSQANIWKSIYTKNPTTLGNAAQEGKIDPRFNIGDFSWVLK